MLCGNGARSVARCEDMHLQSIAAMQYAVRVIHTINTGRKSLRPSVSLPYGNGTPIFQTRYRQKPTSMVIKHHDPEDPTAPPRLLFSGHRYEEKRPKVRRIPSVKIRRVGASQSVEDRKFTIRRLVGSETKEDGKQRGGKEDVSVQRDAETEGLESKAEPEAPDSKPEAGGEGLEPKPEGTQRWPLSQREQRLIGEIKKESTAKKAERQRRVRGRTAEAKKREREKSSVSESDVGNPDGERLITYTLPSEKYLLEREQYSVGESASEDLADAELGQKESLTRSDLDGSGDLRIGEPEQQAPADKPDSGGPEYLSGVMPRRQKPLLESSSDRQGKPAPLNKLASEAPDDPTSRDHEKGEAAADSVSGETHLNAANLEQQNPEPISALEEAEDLTGEMPEPQKISKNLRTVMRALPASVVVVTTSLTVSAPDMHRLGTSIFDAPGPARFTPKLSILKDNSRGMTVSSFTTLTLDPYPIIQFNIRAPSRTLDALMETRHFLVHILAATKTGARIAGAFTKGNSPGPGGSGSPFVNPEAYKIRPLLVEVRRWITDKDGAYIRPKSSEEVKVAWVSAPNAPFKRPQGFSWDDNKRRKPIPLDPPTKAEILEAAEWEKGEKVVLPRLESDDIVTTLHCKVLDRGTRGGRGDGFVKVGDHMMVLARVHDIIGNKLVEHISNSGQKTLAYAHGNFTATGSFINFHEPEKTSPVAAFVDDKSKLIKEAVEASQMLMDSQEVPSESTEPREHQVVDSSEGQAESGCMEPVSEVKSNKHVEQRRLPIRKIATKGLSLREINELANYYASKANNLRTVLQHPVTEPILKNPLQQLVSFGARRSLLISDEDVETEALAKEQGPRIVKHVSLRGASLNEIKEGKEIASKLEIPRRITHEAIQALPDDDAEKRREYAIFKAAEELAARKDEIEALRATRPDSTELDSRHTTDGKRRKHKEDEKEKKFKIHKYEKTTPDLDPELQPKMEQVRQKVESFKNLDYGLTKAEDEQFGYVWRPKHVVKSLNKGQSREDLERRKALEWEASILARREVKLGEKLKHKEWEEKEQALKDLNRAKDRAKRASSKEEIEKERKSSYQEADPFAEEFL